MNRIFLFLVLVFSLCIKSALCQYEDMQLPKFLPPPPDAFQIAKSAQFKPALSTGAVNVSIPLFDYIAGGQKNNLSINYSSNGVLVDEIASRTGMNWTFNPGGVITRTVMDEDDETFPLRTPPVNGFDATQLSQYVYPMVPLNQTDNYNTQPDEYNFSFGGIGGKFFYDHTLALKLTSFSNLKIEKNTGSTTVWKFKITTGDGIVYIFGGSNATEKSKYTNAGCPRIQYAMYTDVAWHLNKIEYPNGEYVNFNYTSYSFSYASGVTQTISALSSASNIPTGQIVWGSTPPLSSATTCQTIINNQAVALQSIVCSNGTLISFSYTERTDVPGEKALQRITQSFNGDVIQRYELVYTNAYSSGFYGGYYNDPPIQFGTNRLFLKEVVNKGRTGNSYISTKIDYEDINGLPPRLSTAQDHYGFFNGKNNQYYIPTLNSIPNDYSVNNQAVGYQVINNFNSRFSNPITADKEPDFNYAVKGSLKKITYATGGSTSFEWESNTVNKFVTTYPAPLSSTINTTGTCSPPFPACSTLVTRFFTVSYDQNLELSGYSGGNTSQNDAVHTRMVVKLTNTSTGAVPYTVSNPILTNINTNVFLSSGNYKLEVTSTDSYIPATLTYTYRPGTTGSAYLNVPVPGLRIKKVTDNDGINNADVTNYYYYKISDPTISTGDNLAVRYYNPTIYEVDYGSYWYGYVPVIIGTATNYYDKVQSSTNYKSYLSGNSSVNYRYVIEAKGDNFNNGAIEHYFHTSYNNPGQIMHGNDIPFAPLADINVMNGLERETSVYAKRNNVLVLQSKTVNQYSNDTRKFAWYDAYVVQSRNQSNIVYQGPPTSTSNLTSFDIIKYPRYSSWVHLDKITQYYYDDNNIELKTEKTITYDNEHIALPGSETVVNSNGVSEKTIYKYIKDYSSVIGLSTNTLNAANDMANKNIVNPLLEKIVTKNGTQIFASRIDYYIWANGKALPEIMSSAYGAGPSLSARVRFYKYDANSNAIEVSKENDIKLAYLWGYNNLFPVMEAQNALKDELFYTSFETEAFGVTDANAKTGNKVATTSYVINFTRPNAKSYISTYHVWNGTKWVYTQQPYSGSSLTITGTKIDEVRVFPVDAGNITTYTYFPLIGVSSTCDVNGRATYYEYDFFNRLTIVRDDNKKVLKKICYNYYGQTVNCTTGCINADPVWQNTAAPLTCQESATCTYTGNQLQEQQDINPCSASYNQKQMVVSGYNPSACTGIPNNNISLSYNVLSVLGFTVVYTNVANPLLTYTFLMPAGTGTLGCIPNGIYNVTISKPGNLSQKVFGCGANYVFGTSATFNNINLNTTSNRTVSIGLLEI